MACALYYMITINYGKRGLMTDSILIKKAEPEDAREIVALYKEVYKGNYPISEYLEPKYVESILKTKKDIWYIAFSEGKCIGSAVGAMDLKNKSIEFGRGAIIEKFQKRGIGKRLYQLIEEDAQNFDIELLYGSLRNKAISEISKNLGLIIAGYSEFYVIGKRTLLLISMKLNDIGKKKRVAPLVKDVYNLKGVQRIIKQMGLEEKCLEYPSDVIAKTNFYGEHIKLEGYYYSPSKGLTIKTLFEKDENIPEYLQATLLADKLEHIKFLQQMGFSITAFLPGWFPKNNKRYDCVLLTKSITPSDINESLKPIVKDLLVEFKHQS